jgi:P27 family predicted phage terminase small subunit
MRLVRRVGVQGVGGRFSGLAGAPDLPRAFRTISKVLTPKEKFKKVAPMPTQRHRNSVEAIQDAPEHLSEKSRALWRQIAPLHARSVGRRTLLEAALAALDQADAADEVVRREGMTKTTGRSGVSHAHPCTKIAFQARAQFLKAWVLLGLSFDPLIDGRIE